MRDIGTLASASDTTSRPVFFVVLHSADMTPTAVLSENLLLEEFGGYVYFKGALFEVQAILAKLDVSSTVNSNLGSGLIRRTASFSVLSNAANGTPYTNSSLTKAIWAAGTPIDSIRFSIWGIDAANLARDINQGVCFGVFEIDADTSWTESTGESIFNLLDVTLANDRIVAATTDPGATELLTFNTGYSPKVIPTVYGAVPRVKMLRGYPDIDLGSGSSTKAYFSGTVPEDYDAVATTIVLEAPSFDSSILRQLIASGNTSVRLRMSTDEVISGTLSYNSGTNKVSITSAVRDTFYYSGKVFTVVGTWSTADSNGNKPSDYDTYKGYYSRLYAMAIASGSFYVTDKQTAYSGILVNREEIDVKGYGYAKMHVSYVDSAGIATDILSYCAVTERPAPLAGAEGGSITFSPIFNGADAIGNYGFKDIPSDATTRSVSAIIYGSYTLTGTGASVDWWTVPKTYDTVDPLIIKTTVSVKLRNSYDSSPFPGPYKQTPYDNIELYFRNPTVALVGGTANETTWRIIGYTGAVSFNHYLNNGYTKVDSSTKLYCEGEEGLMEIPATNITAIESGVSEYGYSTLIRVKLTAPPTGMNIGAKSNEIYIDCAYSSETYGSDFRQILYNLLMSTNKFDRLLSDSNLNPVTYTSLITEPTVGFICSGQSYTEMLDKILFQLSYAVRWNKQGNLDYYDTLATTIDGAGLWTGNIVDANELVENSASISVGKFKTISLDADRDCIKSYLKASYGAWNDPFFKPIEDRDPIGEDEEYIEYSWDCIQTKSSAEWAITRFKKLGAASLSSTIRKSFTLVGDIQLLTAYEPLDCALVNNYPSLTDDASLSTIMTRSASSIQYTLGSANFVLQGVGLFESIDYSLSIGEVGVVITTRYSQSAVDIRGGKIAEVPTKTVPVKTPTAVDETNPGSGVSSSDTVPPAAPAETPGPANSFKITDASGVPGWTAAITANQLVIGNPAGTGEMVSFLAPSTNVGVLVYARNGGGTTKEVHWEQSFAGSVLIGLSTDYTYFSSDLALGETGVSSGRLTIFSNNTIYGGVFQVDPYNRLLQFYSSDDNNSKINIGPGTPSLGYGYEPYITVYSSIQIYAKVSTDPTGSASGYFKASSAGGNTILDVVTLTASNSSFKVTIGGVDRLTSSSVNVTTDVKINGTKVVGARGAAVATVTGTADTTYSANEVTLINALTTAVNAIIARLGSAAGHGLIT